MGMLERILITKNIVEEEVIKTDRKESAINFLPILLIAYSAMSEFRSGEVTGSSLNEFFLFV